MSDRDLKLPTTVGRSGFSEHRFRGRDLFREIAGKEPLAMQIALAIDGRRRSSDAAGMLSDLAAVVALADPRIWPVKLVRVATAFGSPSSGVAAAALAMERAKIGPWTSGEAAELLAEVRGRCGDDPPEVVLTDEMTAQLRQRGRLPGFGVAARRTDERVEALRRCVVARRRHSEPHWKLTERLIDWMRTNRDVEPNISIVFAAAALDLEFAPGRVGLLASALWQVVVLANAAEGAEQAPDVLRRLPDGAVEYRGPEPRVSSRAREQEHQQDAGGETDGEAE